MIDLLGQIPSWIWITGIVVFLILAFLILIAIVAALNPHGKEQARVQRRIDAKSIDAKSTGVTPAPNTTPKPNVLKSLSVWIKNALLPKFILLGLVGWITYEEFQPTLGEMNAWVVAHKFWILGIGICALVLISMSTSTIKDSAQRKQLSNTVVAAMIFLVVGVPTLNFLYGVWLGLQNPPTTTTASGSGSYDTQQFKVTIQEGADTGVINIPYGYAPNVKSEDGLPFEMEVIYPDGKNCWSPFRDCPYEPTGARIFSVANESSEPNTIIYWFTKPLT